MSRRLHLGLALLALLTLLALGGCPRDVQEPEPGEATPCARLEECNGGRACRDDAPMRTCVDGLCARDATLIRPCAAPRGAPDAG